MAATGPRVDRDTVVMFVERVLAQRQPGERCSKSSYRAWLEIESVSVSGLMSTAGQKLTDAAVQATVNSHLEDYFMAPTFTGTSTSGRDVYIASKQTTLYADGGTTVRVFGTRDDFSGGAILNVSVQGHLIDCSAAACS